MPIAISIDTIAGGALAEKVNIKLRKLAENVQDPNTKADAVRTVTLTIKIKPDQTRQVGATEINVKSSLALAKSFERITYMKTGRKSLIFGVHQFLWHPITVWLAWHSLYGRPTWRESVCIVIHDWGYWFTPNMDGPEGERHPEFGARIAGKLFGPAYYDLVLLHSRHYAKLIGKEPSKLCWADKLSILYDPKWFYLLRAVASGEIKEYRRNAREWIPLDRSHSYWFDWIKFRFIHLAHERKANAIPYMCQQDVERE